MMMMTDHPDCAALTERQRAHIRIARLALDAADAGPTPATLAAAPCLALWQVVWIGTDLCLAGQGSGHPHLPDGTVATSPLLALAEDHSWARTLSRFYRLAEPLNTALQPALQPVLGNGAVILDAYGYPAVPLATARLWLGPRAAWIRQMAQT